MFLSYFSEIGDDDDGTVVLKNAVANSIWRALPNAESVGEQVVTDVTNYIVDELKLKDVEQLALIKEGDLTATNQLSVMDARSVLKTWSEWQKKYKGKDKWKGRWEIS